MTDSELLDIGLELVAAWRELGATTVPCLTESFSAVLAKIQAEGRSTWAKTIPLYNTALGKTCHDFQRALSAAHAAGAIGWISPSYSSCVIMMSPREARWRLDEHPERAEILDLARAYLVSVCALPRSETK